MTIPSLLAYLVIASVPVHWYLAWMLWRLGNVKAVRERALVASVLALVVTLFAVVFVNNTFFDPHGASAFASMVITRLAILLLIAPTLYWLYLYRR